MGTEFIHKTEIYGAPILCQKLSDVPWDYKKNQNFCWYPSWDLVLWSTSSLSSEQQVVWGRGWTTSRVWLPPSIWTMLNKFKSLPKSYCKVKNRHALGSCAFYKVMDALNNSRVSALSTNTPEVLSLSRQERGPIEVEPQESTVWEHEETSQEVKILAVKEWMRRRLCKSKDSRDLQVYCKPQMILKLEIAPRRTQHCNFSL